MSRSGDRKTAPHSRVFRHRSSPHPEGTPRKREKGPHDACGSRDSDKGQPGMGVLMMETPDSLPRDFAPDAATARRIVADVLREGRQWLDPLEANRLFSPHDIPVAPVTLAASPEEAAAAALPIFAEGGTSRSRFFSPTPHPQIRCRRRQARSHERRRGAQGGGRYLRAGRAPQAGARVAGVTVQATVRRPKARELIAGTRRRPDLRSGGGVWPRRHRGRDHRRQLISAACSLDL